jgi:hypothetical protein
VSWSMLDEPTDAFSVTETLIARLAGVLTPSRRSRTHWVRMGHGQMLRTLTID